MKRRQLAILLSLLAALVLAAMPAFAQQANELRAVKVATAPTIDAQAETLWAGVPVLTFTTAGGKNQSATNVNLRAVYTNDSIYFLMDWADPSLSDRRLPWQKQADGSWKKLATSTRNMENTYYEDKVALLWDINGITGFAQSGCAATCHAGEQPAGSDFGNKYSPAEGQLGDIWHWKSVRTGSVGQIDDQYLDWTRYNAQTAPEAGRKSDAKTAGGYVNNQTEDGKMPAFTAPDQPAPPYYILDNQKQPFQDTFKANDEIAGIIVAPFTGDRGDIASAQVYKDGKWTLEWGRKLTTGSQTDVQFSALDKVYPFGVATFDNVQVEHATSGLLNLRFVAAAQATPAATAQATPAPGTLPRTGDPSFLALAGMAGVALAGLGFGLRRRLGR